MTIQERLGPGSEPLWEQGLGRDTCQGESGGRSKLLLAFIQKGESFPKPFQCQP